MINIKIDTLYGGVPAPIGGRGAPSSINKLQLAAPWTLTRTGLMGDEQGDTRHHGGFEKALHHYPKDHYATWISELPHCADRLSKVPAFGENISALGITEDDVCVGDILKLGNVTLQISQGRQPCWKLNEVFAVKDMARRVQSSGRTGWYYRVLEPGTINPGDTLHLLERPQPSWPLTRIISLLYCQTENYDELEELSLVAELTESWKKLAERRVAKRKIEDWTPRLEK